jgi:hypothetical protein
MNTTADLALTFATSAAIGLLVGLERERNPRAKAGLRTFALIAVLGSATALLAQAVDSGWVLGAAMLAVGMAIAGAHLVDQETRSDDFGTTTVVAALLVFALGAINVFDYGLLAVALGIGMTALLHFKVELEGAAQRLTAIDIRSILQFGAVSAVILPLLPNEPYGPYGVLNPFHVWLMVVLISGVSLAGYVAWRLTLARKGLLLTGVLGGLVSSTATTLVYARHARNATHTTDAALAVILLANGAMLARVLAIVGILAPGGHRGRRRCRHVSQPDQSAGGLRIRRRLWRDPVAGRLVGRCRRRARDVCAGVRFGTDRCRRDHIVVIAAARYRRRRSARGGDDDRGGSRRQPALQDRARLCRRRAHDRARNGAFDVAAGAGVGGWSGHPLRAGIISLPSHLA